LLFPEVNPTSSRPRKIQAFFPVVLTQGTSQTLVGFLNNCIILLTAAPCQPKGPDGHIARPSAMRHVRNPSWVRSRKGNIEDLVSLAQSKGSRDRGSG
jgi:hypothetical protein